MQTASQQQKTGKRILITVCGRAGSKGFANKNLKTFCGRPQKVLRFLLANPLLPARPQTVIRMRLPVFCCCDAVCMSSSLLFDAVGIDVVTGRFQPLGSGWPRVRASTRRAVSGGLRLAAPSGAGRPGPSGPKA